MLYDALNSARHRSGLLRCLTSGTIKVLRMLYDRFMNALRTQDSRENKLAPHFRIISIHLFLAAQTSGLI